MVKRGHLWRDQHTKYANQTVHLISSFRNDCGNPTKEIKSPLIKSSLWWKLQKSFLSLHFISHYTTAEISKQENKKINKYKSGTALRQNAILKEAVKSSSSYSPCLHHGIFQVILYAVCDEMVLFALAKYWPQPSALLKKQTGFCK